ncbi:hypothetical protein ACOKFD_14485 [Flagellimonas sp. S174]|uniref:hypothetical protein n=1 Tax=Flagellimonas sp. S174 TaxID=3410790 RepID=UPI003BF47BA3
MESSILIAVLSPILLTLGGIISWAIKSKKEEYLTVQEKSREQKITIYETLLEPFIILFTWTLSEKEKQQATKKILSIEYKKAAFSLTSFGSDEVLGSFNRMMQAFFQSEQEEIKPNAESYAIVMLTFLADFMLEIRKDIYDKSTSAKRSDMLKFMITDIETFKNQINVLDTNDSLTRLFSKY